MPYATLVSFHPKPDLQLTPELALVYGVHGAADRTTKHFGEHLVVPQNSVGSIFARAVRFLCVLFVAVLIQNFTPDLQFQVGQYSVRAAVRIGEFELDLNRIHSNCFDESFFFSENDLNSNWSG